MTNSTSKYCTRVEVSDGDTNTLAYYDSGPCIVSSAIANNILKHKVLE
jgi:hypothetical protein